ncbi:MAG: hypothetical protein GXO71_08060 [Caldiserica bacterium]|nr:hypothetical protein [Caldisericota bacterium]
MRLRERIIWIVVGFLLLINLFTLLNTPLRAQALLPPSPVALSAGEKGVVYFYDGANLWLSRDYGENWKKVK